MKSLGLFLVVGLLFITPLFVSAEGANGAVQAAAANGSQVDSGLVTCSGLDCDACDLIKMTNRIVNFLITLLTIAATVMVVVAGFRLVTSGGDTGAMQSAKKMFTNVLIGFVIVLSAWLLVDTVLKTLTSDGQGLEMWTKIDNCGGIKYKESDDSKEVNANVDSSVRAVNSSPGGDNGPGGKNSNTIRSSAPIGN